MTTTKGFVAKLERITPTKARAYLKANVINRPFKDSVCGRYVHALREGHWRVTHQGIAFNGEGQLLDGQHRLEAIVRSNIPAEMMVTRGVSQDTFLAIDTGSSRTPADHMALAGYRNPNVLARALYLQFVYDQCQGDLERRLSPEKMPDKDDLMAVASSHPELVRICQDAGPDRPVTRDLLTPPLWALLCYQFSLRDADLAAEFMDALSTGASLKEDSIVLLTRNRCFSISGDVRAKRRPALAASMEKASLVVRAWNRVRAGKEHGAKKVMGRRISTEFPAIV